MRGNIAQIAEKKFHNNFAKYFWGKLNENKFNLTIEQSQIVHVQFNVINKFLPTSATTTKQFPYDLHVLNNHHR